MLRIGGLISEVGPIGQEVEGFPWSWLKLRTIGLRGNHTIHLFFSSRGQAAATKSSNELPSGNPIF